MTQRPSAAALQIADVLLEVAAAELTAPRSLTVSERQSSSAALVIHCSSAAALQMAGVLLQYAAADMAAPGPLAVFHRDGPLDCLVDNSVGDLCPHQLNRSLQDYFVTAKTTRKYQYCSYSHVGQGW